MEVWKRSQILHSYKAIVISNNSYWANIASNQFRATSAGVNFSVGEEAAQHLSSITTFNHRLPPARGKARSEGTKRQ